VLLPRENEKDLSEIPDDILKQLEIRLVETMDEVLESALDGPVPSIELRDGEAPVDKSATGDSVTH